MVRVHEKALRIRPELGAPTRVRILRGEPLLFRVGSRHLKSHIFAELSFRSGFFIQYAPTNTCRLWTLRNIPSEVTSCTSRRTGEFGGKILPKRFRGVHWGAHSSRAGLPLFGSFPYVVIARREEFTARRSEA